MRRFILSLLGICLLTSAPARADIKAYNEAVKRGDFPAAAGEATGVWSAFDKSAPEAADVARDFAYIAMLAKRRDLAKTYTDWLRSEAGASADKSPALSLVLQRWAELDPNPSKAQRQALSDALKARLEAIPQGEKMSMMAAAELYSAHWQADDFPAVSRDAAIAAELAGRAKAPAARYHARIMQVAADFVARRELTSMRTMLSIMGEIDGQIPDSDTSIVRDGPLAQLFYSASAWHGAMKSYFITTGQLLPTQLKEYERMEAESRLCAGCKPSRRVSDLKTADGRVRCDGKWNIALKPDYPAQARYSGLVGALIYRITTDAEGDVISYKLMASVPSEEFDQAARKGLNRARLVRRSTDPAGCALEGDRELQVEFVLATR